MPNLPRRGVLLPNMYQIGVQSVPVVIVTGAFIGMVIAVQSYDQFRFMHMETNLGAVINISLVKELGPKAREKALVEPVVSTQQFFGIDVKGFAVELAKVTLMIAKKLNDRAQFGS